MKKIDGFDVGAYQQRLRILRKIISGENQQEFAERLGIGMMRWNNYERGYPVPREVAFLLMQKFPGISVEWIWFGMTGNLSQHYAKRIAALEEEAREEARALKVLERAQSKVKDIQQRRKKQVVQTSSSSS